MPISVQRIDAWLSRVGSNYFGNLALAACNLFHRTGLNIFAFLGLTANLGGTNSAFHVPGAASGSESNSPPVTADPSSPYLTNGVQHANLLTTLQAAAAVQASAAAVGSGGVGGTKTVGTVLPLVSPPKINHLPPLDRPIKSSPVSTSATDGESDSCLPESDLG